MRSISRDHSVVMLCNKHLTDDGLLCWVWPHHLLDQQSDWWPAFEGGPTVPL